MEAEAEMLPSNLGALGTPRIMLRPSPLESHRAGVHILPAPHTRSSRLSIWLFPGTAVYDADIYPSAYFAREPECMPL